jgi:hypothetical protein
MKLNMKMLGLAVFVAALTSILVVSATLVPVSAVGSVWTEDMAGNKKTVFNLGETVVIKWVMENGPVNVTLTRPDGTVIGLGAFPGANGSTTYNPPMVGNYMVLAEGPGGVAKWDFAICTFTVIPEVPIGIIAITTVGLLGLAVFRRFKF